MYVVRITRGNDLRLQKSRCATVCKRFALCYRTVVLSVLLSICLWRWCIVGKRLDGSRWNLARRPRPRSHCVRWGPSPPPPKNKGQSPQFSAHVRCGQTAGWIKMSLRTEVGLGPGDFVLDGDPADKIRGDMIETYKFKIASRKYDNKITPTLSLYQITYVCSTYY